MIEIIRTAELYQQQDGGFKAAIYFSEDAAEAFLSLKRQVTKDGKKMALVLMVSDQADVSDRLTISHADALHYASILEGVSKALKKEHQGQPEEVVL